MAVKFSPELARKICAHLADGLSLRKIEKLPGMPTASCVYGWLLDGEEAIAEGNSEDPKAKFIEQYTRAREIQADNLAEETIDIADDVANDLGFDDDGKPFLKLDNVQRARLRVDARRWYAGKVRPKKYGDKQIIEGGDKPIKTDNTVTFYMPEKVPHE